MIRGLRKLFRPPGNFKRISRLTYRAYNQNGFNNALYDFFGVTDDVKAPGWTKKDYREMMQNWPKKYPCTFVIDNQTLECGRIYIDVI